MKLYSKILIVILVVFTSCKSNKNALDNTNVNAITTKKIISNHYDSNFNQKTINAKLNAKYNDNKTSVTFSIKLRLEKDKTIWMSATKFGIPVVCTYYANSQNISKEDFIKNIRSDTNFNTITIETDPQEAQNLIYILATLIPINKS